MATRMERGINVRYLTKMAVFVILTGFVAMQLALPLLGQVTAANDSQPVLYADKDKPAPTDPKPKPPENDPNAKPPAPPEDDGGCNC